MSDLSLPPDPELLFASIYSELKRLAHSQFAGKAARTLCTTALVHEAYLKLISANAAVQDRAHFVSLVIRAMRQILTDAARRRNAARRGGDKDFGEQFLVTIESCHGKQKAVDEVDALALEQAIERLKAVHERLANVVEMHFYGGLSFAEVAELLGVTERTVQRDWSAARALLQRDLEIKP